MQFQRNITIESDVGFHIHVYLYWSSLNNGNSLHESTNWHVSVGLVLGSFGFQMQTPGEWDMAKIAAFYLVPSMPMYGICLFGLKHWIRFKKNSKLHVYCQKKTQKKQQGHLLTCNIGANKYWVHVWLIRIDFIMCNIARFWIFSCLYGNNSDVAFD